MEIMNKIVQAIRAAGYEPYEQLTGFAGTGNERFVTRSGNARAMARQLGREAVEAFLRSVPQ